MNSRLAQIIAGCVGPDGKADRAKIFEAMQTTPDAPEALLLEAAIACDDMLRNTERLCASHIEKMRVLHADAEARIVNALQATPPILVEAQAMLRASAMNIRATAVRIVAAYIFVFAGGTALGVALAPLIKHVLVTTQ